MAGGLDLSKGELEAVGLEYIFKTLDSIHIPIRGRIKWLSEKTGYSRTQVGDILAGRRTLTDRFKRLAIDAMVREIEAQFNKYKSSPEFISIKAKVAAHHIETTVLTDAADLENSLVEKFGPEIVQTIKDGVKAQIDSLTLPEVLQVSGHIKTIVDSRNEKQ